jgi:hypothetical protein
MEGLNPILELRIVWISRKILDRRLDRDFDFDRVLDRVFAISTMGN